MGFFLNRLLGAKSPQRNIPSYEFFFQVEAVKHDASSYSFYTGVRIPIAKMAFLPVCEITFI